MKKLAILLFLVINIFFVNVSHAQISSMSAVRRSFATVMLAGLGGAVLGLSTLSFYGNPQEHIGNIWTGATLGVLAGGAFVIVSSTNNYRMQDAYSIHDFSPRKNRVISVPTVFSYNF